MSVIGNKRRRMEARAALFMRQNGRCFYCASERHFGDKEWTLDHLVPRCRGGTNDLSNLVLACSSCNNRRGHRHWVRFKDSLRAEMPA